MHKRGIRVLPGGDYGFAWIPHGTNAKDLEYFVKYLGFTPMEALMAATKYGGQIMLKPNELGQIKEGYLADTALGRWRSGLEHFHTARQESRCSPS